MGRRGSAEAMADGTEDGHRTLNFDWAEVENGFVFPVGFVHLLIFSHVCRQIENSKMGSFGNFLFLKGAVLRELRK